MYLGRIERLLTYYTPLPMCIINSQGKVTRANSRMAAVFKYDGIAGMDIFQLTGVKMPDFIAAAANNTPIFITRNDKDFKLSCGFLGEGEDASVVVLFFDSSAYENLKRMYYDDRTCVAVVNIDNFDEIENTKSGEEEVEITVQIDRLLRKWVSDMQGILTKYKENLFKVILSQKAVRQQVENKFSILDDVRKIETDMDFPVSISIGLGIGGKTLAENDNYAQDAMDMALGRGGDQAVIKRVKNFEYFGGKTQSVEKSNKGKSRIIAHALRTLMQQSSKIFVMGHHNPDMDCFGAALGIHRIAASTGKETFIVMNEYNETMDDIVRDAKDTELYNFVSSKRAMELADKKSLVVVVDTHRPSLVESMELVNFVEKLAVIDHHRKNEDALPEQTLSYMESYASSASELVTEMLQYVSDKKEVNKIEADALLAGIMLDTNRFAVKAGVRTFEAASWLKRAGADLQNVRRYFQSNAEDFRARAEGVANAVILDTGIALSVREGRNENSQVINSQIADELLTIKGVEASFVAGLDYNGDTVVSARSLGNINVQLIMEGFGGGGHMNTAGARVNIPPKDILHKIADVLKSTQ